MRMRVGNFCVTVLFSGLLCAAGEATLTETVIHEVYLTEIGINTTSYVNYHDASAWHGASKISLAVHCWQNNTLGTAHDETIRASLCSSGAEPEHCTIPAVRYDYRMTGRRLDRSGSLIRPILSDVTPGQEMVRCAMFSKLPSSDIWTTILPADDCEFDFMQSSSPLVCTTPVDSHGNRFNSLRLVF